MKIMFTGSNVEEGDRAILEYVESRCFVHRDGKRLGQADYFIELPMDWNMEQASVNRVLKLFDKAVVEARKHAPKYNIWDRTCSFDKGRCKGDEFCQTVHVTQDGASPWEVPYRMLDNAKNEQEALDVIGAVTLLNHPNLFGIYRALEQVRGRLSPDTVFGNGFLERVTRYDKDRGAAPLYLSTLDDASDDDGELAPHRRS